MPLAETWCSGLLAAAPVLPSLGLRDLEPQERWRRAVPSGAAGWALVCGRSWGTRGAAAQLEHGARGSARLQCQPLTGACGKPRPDAPHPGAALREHLPLLSGGRSRRSRGNGVWPRGTAPSSLPKQCLAKGAAAPSHPPPRPGANPAARPGCEACVAGSAAMDTYVVMELGCADSSQPSRGVHKRPPPQRAGCKALDARMLSEVPAPEECVPR